MSQLQTNIMGGTAGDSAVTAPGLEKPNTTTVPTQNTTRHNSYKLKSGEKLGTTTPKGSKPNIGGSIPSKKDRRVWKPKTNSGNNNNGQAEVQKKRPAVAGGTRNAKREHAVATSIVATIQEMQGENDALREQIEDPVIDTEVRTEESIISEEQSNDTTGGPEEEGPVHGPTKCMKFADKTTYRTLHEEVSSETSIVAWAVGIAIALCVSVYVFLALCEFFTFGVMATLAFMGKYLFYPLLLISIKVLWSPFFRIILAVIFSFYDRRGFSVPYWITHEPVTHYVEQWVDAGLNSGYYNVEQVYLEDRFVWTRRIGGNGDLTWLLKKLDHVRIPWYIQKIYTACIFCILYCLPFQRRAYVVRELYLDHCKSDAYQPGITDYAWKLGEDVRPLDSTSIKLQLPEAGHDYIIDSHKEIRFVLPMYGWADDKLIWTYRGKDLKRVSMHTSTTLLAQFSNSNILTTNGDVKLFRDRIDLKAMGVKGINIDSYSASLNGIYQDTKDLIYYFWTDSLYQRDIRPF